MKQVIQSYKNGNVKLKNVPVPHCGTKSILIKNQTSLISIGTERSIIDLGRKSLAMKAAARPDLVRRVWDKAKKEGVTMNQLIIGDQFQKRIKKHLDLKQEQLKEQMEIVELKRYELTKATQKKRVFEILKEKEIKEYNSEKLRLERLEADEIAQNYRRFSQN